MWPIRPAVPSDAVVLADGPEVARRPGAGSLWLAIAEHNDRATPFSARCGFEVVGKMAFVTADDRRQGHVMTVPMDDLLARLP